MSLQWPSRAGSRPERRVKGRRIPAVEAFLQSDVCSHVNHLVVKTLQLEIDGMDPRPTDTFLLGRGPSFAKQPPRTQARYLPPLCSVLQRGSVAPGIPMQPIIHYLFLDLDPLLFTINMHLLAQPTIFPQELARMSADGVLLRAERLTELLDGQRLQQPSLVICRSGSYFNGSLENARSLQTAGWNLKKKGALDHRSLEDLMEKNLEQVGASRQSGGAPKKMVLATGELRPPTQSCVQAYLGSGWHVKLFCLQRCWSQTLDELGRMHPGRFEVVYLDQHLRELLASNSLTAETASARARGASLLSQMATDGALWNRANVRRGSSRSVPHARALALATASPGPPSSFRHQNSSEVRSEENDQVCKQERDAAKRRQSRLATLPNVYSMENRERYVFLNLDNIAGVLFTSHTLYRRIDGAGSPQDVRLDFRALTQHLCGESESAAVKCQVAAYCKSSPYLARALAGLGWTLIAPMTPGSSDNGLHVEMMSKLVDGAYTASEKTLVLAMGDGGLGGTKTNAYRTIIGKFLEQRWHVEIHAWLHALNDGLIDLQAQYPGRVVVKPLDEFISNLVYPKNQERAKAFGALAEPANTSLNQDRPLVTPSGVNVPGGSSLEPSVTNYTAGTSVGLATRNVSGLGLHPPLPPPQSTVMALQQQIQQMQAAFSALQASVSTEQQLRQENDELLKGMREQASAFEEERTRQAASAAQQAHDARLARRLQLKDREESLICPITCDLYKEPVTTVCCGKTFSAEVVKRLKECPWCRTSNLATHPNRDVASLVEQYCAERDELDAEEGEILSQ